MDYITLANNNIEIIAKLITDNKAAFESMDLKLHDVSYYVYDKAQTEYSDLPYDFNDLFYDFCELSYDLMIEDFNISGLEFKPDIIGRTSKFYIDKKYNLSYGIDSLIMELLNYGCYQYNVIPDIENNHIIVDQWIIEDDTNIMYIASSEFIEDCKKQLQPIIDIYDYINGFKKDQINIFKEYLNNLLEDIRHQKECEDKHNFEVWLSGVEKIIA